MTDQQPNPQVIHNALRSIPHAKFVLTCCHGEYRDGIITRWVQRCSSEPPMIVVAIPKGKMIEPMLRDARAFALCMVKENDRSVQRLFGSEHELGDDPFLSLSVHKSVNGMPILEQSLVWFDCKLEGHLSPDADCRLYLGQVVAAHISKQHQDEIVVPPTSSKHKSILVRSIQTVQKFQQ
ncbi:MAG: flavin reductase family protein [Phycisphaerales bacterium]|nr:flavin reductase family protein [Planctomycetota bacterium]MBL6997376.1 flavin reductase family protein [Phycisphaerales bacterium]